MTFSFRKKGDGLIVVANAEFGRVRVEFAADGSIIKHECVVNPTADAPATPAERKPRPPRKFPLPKWPCVHRGAQNGTAACGGCGGKTLVLPVFTCTVHGDCTVERMSQKVGRACCKVCKERKAPETTLDTLLQAATASV